VDLKLKWEGKSGDGKSASVVAVQNDGWRDLRITVDTDDVDSDFAIAAMQEVIDRVNAAGKKVYRAPNPEDIGKNVEFSICDDSFEDVITTTLERIVYSAGKPLYCGCGLPETECARIAK